MPKACSCGLCGYGKRGVSRPWDVNTDLEVGYLVSHNYIQLLTKRNAKIDPK